MGDRALIQFENAGERSPVIYLHWHGHAVGGLLEKTKAIIEATDERMRGRHGDVAYCAARFVGVAHDMIDGNLSLGIWNHENRLTAKDSHGDAGCFVINADSFRVECLGGYGLTDRESDDV